MVKGERMEPRIVVPDVDDMETVVTALVLYAERVSISVQRTGDLRLAVSELAIVGALLSELREAAQKMMAENMFGPIPQSDGEMTDAVEKIHKMMRRDLGKDDQG